MEIVNGTWLSNCIRAEMEEHIAELEKAQKSSLNITFGSGFIPAENYREELVFIRQGGLLQWFKKVFIRMQCGTAKNESLITIYHFPESTADLVCKVKELIEAFAKVHPGFNIHVEIDPK